MLSLPLNLFAHKTATTQDYTLSLHDALPIWRAALRPPETPRPGRGTLSGARRGGSPHSVPRPGDRKSTRLNSSHANISYAVVCLKKKIRKSVVPELLKSHVEAMSRF